VGRTRGASLGHTSRASHSTESMLGAWRKLPMLTRCFRAANEGSDATGGGGWQYHRDNATWWEQERVSRVRVDARGGACEQ
jgi:hypothetical protein